MISNEGLALGVVVASYPEGNSVDVILKDGSRLFNVQVSVWTGSSNTGVIDLPDIGLPADETRWNLALAPDRYVRAIVGFMNGLPVVLGFLLPQVNQITFKEKNRRIMKHASDVYTSIDQFGNIEVAHPSGMFLRIGTTPGHEDLTGKDLDKKFAIKNNTEPPVYVHLEMAGNTASLDIAPNGAITIITASTISATAAGAVVVNAPSATINAPESHCTGSLLVDGKITGTGGMAISGGEGATVEGSMAITGGDVTADGVGLKSHDHTDPQGGTVGNAFG